MILIWFNQVTIIVAKAIDGMIRDIIGLLIYCYFPPNFSERLKRTDMDQFLHWLDFCGSPMRAVFRFF